MDCGEVHMARKEGEDSRESLADKVYNELRTAIVLGEMAPGAVLNEGELLQKFGVSTSPLREALTRLRQDGLIKVIPRKGHVVTEITLTDFHDIIQMRLVLESAAAELAAPRVTDAHIRELNRLSCVTLAIGDKASYREFMRANQAFHELIATIGGNQRLARAVTQNFEEVQRLLFSGLDLDLSPTDEHDHREIIAALAKRDAEASRQAVIEHIKISRDRIVERLLRATDNLATKPLKF